MIFVSLEVGNAVATIMPNVVGRPCIRVLQSRRLPLTAQRKAIYFFVPGIVVLLSVTAPRPTPLKCASPRVSVSLASGLGQLAVLVRSVVSILVQAKRVRHALGPFAQGAFRTARKTVTATHAVLGRVRRLGLRDQMQLIPPALRGATHANPHTFVQKKIC